MSEDALVDAILTGAAIALMLPIMLKQRYEYLQANGYKREKRLLFVFGWAIVLILSMEFADLVNYAFDIPYIGGVLKVTYAVCLFRIYFPPRGGK